MTDSSVAFYSTLFMGGLASFVNANSAQFG
jgi:hypothetical protein